MKNGIKAVSLLAVLFAISTAQADHHNESGYAALDVQFCNFKPKKSVKDVLKVAAEFQSWAGENLSRKYTGYLWTPVISNSQDFGYDYIWFGVSDTHESLGTVFDEYTVKGDAMSKKWEAVETCEDRRLMTGISAKPFKSTTGHAYMQVSGCEFKDGKTFNDLIAADTAWVKWMDESGMPGGMMRFIPSVGGPVASTIDVYAIYATESLADRGRAHDMMIGGGSAVLSATYGEVMSCDAPRIYHSTPASGK